MPGIDSLKDERRRYDFLEDIHDANLYYFTSKSLNYHLSKNGYKSLFIDNEIKSLFIKSEKKINNFENLHSDTLNVINKSEFKKKIY